MRRISVRSLSFWFCLVVSPLVTPVAAQFDPVGEILLPAGATRFRWAAEKDGYAYTTGSARFAVYDVRALDIDGPFASFNSPVIVRDIPSCMGLVRNGNLLYVFGAGVRTLDITNPANPTEVSSAVGHTITNLVKDGDYLFAAGPDFAGVYSISDPSHPTLVASMTLDGRSGYSVARAGQYVYVGEIGSSPSYYGLRVLSWPGGASLTTVYQTTTEEVPFQLFIKGSYLADCWTNAVRLWSLADPSRPVEVARQSVSNARMALLWGDKLITNGKIFSWHGPLLELFSTFTTGGSQPDGSPYGGVATSKFVFLAQQTRILILTAPPTLTFPQYVNGLTGSTPNRTRLILRNRGASQATGLVQFRNSAGAPHSVPIGGVNQSEKPFSVAAGGTLQISTDGTGTLTVGSLEVRSDTVGDTHLGGTEIFDVLGHTVSIQKAPLATTHEAFVSRTATENTGFAPYNPSLTTTSQLQVRLLDKYGNQVAGPVSLSLLPRQQLPIFINEAALFQAYFSSLTGDFEGTVKIVVQSGGPVAVASLIQTSSGVLLAVPVDSQVTGP